MENKVLTVEGMSCNHCKMAVEKALSGLGVKAGVNLEKKEVRIEYDPAKVTLEQIVNEIEEQGYDVVK